MTNPHHDSRGLSVPATVDREVIHLSTRYAPPRTELEAKLADLWSQRLGVAPIGVDDDFFELGGHSLAAAELLDDIATRLGVEVPAQTLFLEPSIAELAAAIGAMRDRAEAR